MTETPCETKQRKTAKKTELKLIDFAKLFFAICVVMNHSGLFAGDDMPPYLIKNSIIRLAVPFFFCVSGYFLHKSLEKSDNVKAARTKYIKRLFPPLFFWLILNLPLVIMQYLLDGDGLKEIILKLGRGLIFYQWGALWYIPALVVSILIIIPFYKKKKLEKIATIGLILYLVGLVFNTYYFVVEGTAIQKTIDSILKIVVSMRNGLFEGLFFVSSGMLISKYEKSKKTLVKLSIFCLITSYIILLIENTLTKNLPFKDSHSLYISFIFVIPSLVLLLSRFKSVQKTSTAIIARKFSTGIYFSHRFVLAIVELFILQHVDNAWAVFGTTIAIDIVLLSILYKINNEKINLLIT